jgi:hypothetical protein
MSKLKPWARLAVVVVAAICVVWLLEILSRPHSANHPYVDTRKHPSHALEDYVLRAAEHAREHASASTSTATRHTQSAVRKAQAHTFPADVFKLRQPKAVKKAAPTALETPIANYRKAIVMGKLSSEDTDWVGDKLPDWERAIYVVDLPAGKSSPTGLRTKINKAREAFPYLTYIVEHYSTLPDIAVFMHAHPGGWPQAWHNDAPGHNAARMLKDLKLETVLKRGFQNLRCIHEPGCPVVIDLNRNATDPAKRAEIAYPYVYADFFNMTAEAVRKETPIVASPCCAQFAVTKAEIVKRPKAEYERILKIVERSELDDQTLGTVLEYTWHILFGKDAVNCEDQKTCWWEVYGRKSAAIQRRLERGLQI